VIGWKESEDRKRGRFWQRFYTGAELADRLRFLTLNSSDESVVLGLDILESFARLVKRIRWRWGVFEYFGVKERSLEEALRYHLHLICKGVYMPQSELEDMWVATHRSIKPYITEVNSVGGAAGYLAKYIAEQGVGRYIWSSGWIFPGYVGWSQRFRRVMGYYPDGDVVRYVAGLPKEERDGVLVREKIASCGRQ